MGFCRRCGDIVSGTRCKCGGTAVAPVVSWNQGCNKEGLNDPWSRTYVAQDSSTSSTLTTTTTPSSSVSDPTKRFPRPQSRYGANTQSSNPLGHRVTAHITATTSLPTRSSPPLKQSVAAPEAGILPSPSPHDKSLSKVYGSVLQSADSLATHCCAVCASVFAPDATIYPNPTTSDLDAPVFLCRPCFTVNGGSKGACPTCARPVLALKAEGGFIEVDNRYWHKHCFNCEGCFKYIGDAPMVDLMGHPSCSDCFENCLKRDRTPKKRESAVITASPVPHIGFDPRSREGSPTISELEHRLGIRSREASPSAEARDQGSPCGSGRYSSTRASLASSVSPPSQPSIPQSRASIAEPTSPSPHGKYERFRTANLARRSVDLKFPPTSPTRSMEVDVTPTKHTPERRTRMSHSSPPVSPPTFPSGRLFPSPTSKASPQTPDLISDFSDTATMSSLNLDSPFMNAYEPRREARPRIADSDSDDGGTSPRPMFTDPVKPVNRPSPPIVPVAENANTNCAKCHRRLFSIASVGRYVTVPDSTGVLETYHQNCFKCSVCSLPFKESSQGQAIFVRGQQGPSHLECSPPQRTVKTNTGSPSTSALSPTRRPLSQSGSPSADRKSPASSPGPKTAATPPSPGRAQQSSRYQRPVTTIFTGTTPRFGGSAACPGCHQSVSPMERGVVPGPQGSRWHATCLVCGGKSSTPGTPAFSRGRQGRKSGEAGCGKKLDSAAKSDEDGNVWCRDCLLLLSNSSRGSPSPTRAPLLPSHTGQRVMPQLTGTTTIARQFTGMGSGDGSLLRHLTGGGTSPTRSVSPTKQLALRPRPKSVIGSRSKSIDEGRGMFLVRQMTGSGGN